MAEGNLSKLQIICYQKDKMETEDESIYVPVNPDRYSRSISIKYNKQQAHGTQGNNPKYHQTPPEELQFDFLFDGTGVVPDSKDIHSALEKLQKIVYRVEGNIHRPRFLKLLWGELAFNCVLKDMKIDYTLFKPDGTPLRAMVNATFMAVVNDKRAAADQGNSSPDLTHIRYVKEGDTLPLMTYRIYGDASLYIQVAKYNGLTNFRNLKPHTRIVFPPIDKTAV